MATNNERADWAREAIEPFANATFKRGFDDLVPGDRKDCIADLICDLLHLAEREGIDGVAALEQAVGNYEYEHAEAAGDWDRETD